MRMTLTYLSLLPLLLLPPGMMAPDGRCKALDATADGYVRAEAAVVVMLQSAALVPDSSAWPLVAVVLAGSAVNQDGRSSSLMAPHGPSQQQVILAALASCGLAPAGLRAVEMHGTGRLALHCPVLQWLGLACCLASPWLNSLLGAYQTYQSLCRVQGLLWATPSRSARLLLSSSGSTRAQLWSWLQPSHILATRRQRPV